MNNRYGGSAYATIVQA